MDNKLYMNGEEFPREYDGYEFNLYFDYFYDRLEYGFLMTYEKNGSELLCVYNNDLFECIQEFRERCQELEII